MKFASACAVLSLLLLPLGRASVVTKDGQYIVSGNMPLLFTDFSGTSSGINIDLGSGSQPSGPLTFSLDPSAMSQQLIDFDNALMQLDLHLLITFPLQTSIGAAPVPIEVIETAALPAFLLDFTGPLSLSATEHHAGTIGQPLLPDQSTTGLGTGTYQNVSNPNLIFFLFDSALFSGGGTVTAGAFAGFTYANDEMLEASGKIMGQEFSVKYTSTSPEPGSAILVVIGIFLAAGSRRAFSLARTETPGFWGKIRLR